MPELLGRGATTYQGILTPPINGTAALVHKGKYSIKAICGSKVTLRPVDRYNLFSLGYAGYDTKGFLGELSGYSGTARGGGHLRKTLSLLILSASGTTTQSGSALLRLSGYSVNIRGTTDAYGRLQKTLPKITGVAQGGGRAVGVGPKLTIVSSGKTDKIAKVIKTLPKLRLVASGTVDNRGGVVGILPGLEIAPSGVMRGGLLPRATIYILGSQALAAYEAYSFTMVKDSKGVESARATHYTNYPFDRIVRFGSKYYGVAVGGLFELAGNTFDGTPIVATVETAPTDFGARELKRAFSLYIGGRVGADFVVSVKSAEVNDDSYVFRPFDKTGARNYRTLFGKGIRERYLAYAFTNTDGGDFEVDDITPEVVVQRRTA